MQTKVDNLTKHSFLEFDKNSLFTVLWSIFLIKS